MSRAIGMLETYGLLSAIEGLDAALKAANVSVRSFEYVSGGLITWIVDGEVGAVRVAVAAGKAAALRVGDVVSDHVIARVALDVAEVLPPPRRPGGRKGGTGIHRRDFPVKCCKHEPSEATPETPQAEAPTVEEPVIVPVEAPPPKKSAPSSRQHERDELEATGVHALRSIARQIEGIGLTRIEIRDARKDTLVKAILEAQDKARG